MYQSFAAVVRKGKIEPIEKVKLRNSARLVVTVVDAEENATEWPRLRRWIATQRKAGKYKAYGSVNDAKLHLRRLMKS